MNTLDKATKVEPLDPPVSVVAPALWSPIIITLLGIPLGFVFSSVLIALNWHRLARHGMAAFAYVFAVLYAVGVQQPLLPLLPWPWPFVVGILVWFPFLGLPQWQYLREKVAKPYPKRSWSRAIGIGVASQVMVLIWGQPDQTAQPAPPAGTSAAPPSAAEHEYTPEELTSIVQHFVLEVRTTWKVRSYIFFQNDGGCAGSAVLFKGVAGHLYLVTNRHVVEAPQGAQQYVCQVRYAGSQEAQSVEVLAFGKNGLDLALLRLNTPDVKEPFNVRTTPAGDVVPGEACIALGNALASGISVTSGIISRFDNDGRTVFIRTSAPISHGNSGGGLFRLKGGTLIGITTAMRTDGQNVNLAIPADYFNGEEYWEYLPGVTR